ncbi:hypothetical protein NESM_000571500 [Novymonas esmeraldas]|uniref:DUF2066 domain-containing protein n=1 Tax=Novymonas esmeraldas TaxID=1808958 RepID=A0AAW0ERT1_9TRYP
MTSCRAVALYFADRHTAAVAAALVIYALVIAWCGSTGSQEVQLRAAAVARRHGGVAGGGSGVSSALSSSFSTAAVSHSVVVAVVQLTDADVELLHGGGGGAPPLTAPLLRSMTWRWQYTFAVGDFTLISAPPGVASGGILKQWVKALEAAFPRCVFASLDRTGDDAADAAGAEEGRRLLQLPDAWRARRLAWMGAKGQQSLRVLRLDALPTPPQLRVTKGNSAHKKRGEAEDDDGGTEDALFVFVTQEAVRGWSAAVAAADAARPPAQQWLNGDAGLNAWGEMLVRTSMTSSRPPATPAAPDVHRVQERRRGVAEAAVPPVATDVIDYIPRLAAALAREYSAPQVLLASWCSSAGAHVWVGLGGRQEPPVHVLCLNASELLEITPAQRRAIRLPLH